MQPACRGRSGDCSVHGRARLTQLNPHLHCSVIGTCLGTVELRKVLLGHDTLTRPTDVLGTQFDYQFTYEHGALAAHTRSPATYRYLRLPDEIGLSKSDLNRRCGNVSIVIPALHAEFGSQGVALQRAAGPEPISPPRVSYSDWRDVPPILRPYVRPEHREH